MRAVYSVDSPNFARVRLKLALIEYPVNTPFRHQSAQ